MTDSVWPARTARKLGGPRESVSDRAVASPRGALGDGARARRVALCFALTGCTATLNFDPGRLPPGRVDAGVQEAAVSADAAPESAVDARPCAPACEAPEVCDRGRCECGGGTRRCLAGGACQTCCTDSECPNNNRCCLGQCCRGGACNPRCNP